MSGIKDVENNVISGLEIYTATVTESLHPDGVGVQINVRVTLQERQTFCLQGIDIPRQGQYHEL